MPSEMTPQVGDRVLVSFAIGATGGTSAGWVRRITTEGHVVVHLDSYREYVPTVVYPSRVSVVHRRSGEWPQGWQPDANGFAFHDETNVAFRKKDLIALLENAHEMLARWDELMEDN
jgi:chitodextrinase